MALTSTNIDPSVVEIGDKGINKDISSMVAEQLDTILDDTWVKNAFLVPDNKLDNSGDITNRYWSSASVKFTDTTLGGNIGINSKPQFTRYADTRVKGRLTGRNDVSVGSSSGNYGMGRYYSEAIDDPSQTIYLRFGVPQFNSLSNFISKMIDPELSTMARTGRPPSAFYSLAKTAATVGAIVLAPAIAAPILAGRFISSFFARSTSKFYTLKPSMHMYWSTVNSLVGTLAVNRGIYPKILSDEAEQKIGQPFKLDEAYLKQISKLLPDVFRGNNNFDMYSIANRAQRIANQLFEDDFSKLDSGTSTDFTGLVQKNVSGDGDHATYISDQNGDATLIARLNKIASFGHYQTTAPDQETERNPRIDDNGNPRGEDSWFGEFKKDLDGEFRDGSQYIAFKVNSTGQVQESFGNSSAESDLAQKLNSTSSSSRQARFSFAEGNIADVGGVVGSVLGNIGDVVTGALDGVTLGYSNIFKALAGNSYVDIPKYWQSSTATLPKSTYTIKLISPYGNAISQMQNIYIPLASLLAGTLPLSTGKQSYTSPFLCELYDRGRQQIRLGMIESLSISRGTANLGFDLQGKPLAIDVSFSVVDLSSIMHMPISSGSVFKTDMSLDEDNILVDYLAVLTGQGMYEQIYTMPKAKLTLAKKIMGASKLTSPAYWSSMFHDSSTQGVLQKLTFGAFNAIEGVSRTSSLVTR